MRKFRLTRDGGSSWEVVEGDLPYTDPCQREDEITVEPIGNAVTLAAQAPTGTLVSWGTWSYLSGGSGTAAENPAATLATLSSAASSVAGSGQGTSGVTNTGICRDIKRDRYIIGNHGQDVEGSSTPAASSLITIDRSFAKISEVALDYGSPHSAIQGIQGITVDTKSDLVAVCVPSIAAINFFDPTTLLYSSRLMLTGVVAQPNGIAYDTRRDAFWVTDNADQVIRLISRSGDVLKSYQAAGRQADGLDMLDYDPVADCVLFSAGNASAGSGSVWQLHAEYLRVIRSFRSSEGLAPEGVSRSLDGTQIILASDGEFHASTPSPGISSPNNVNQWLRYPSASLVDYRFARLQTTGTKNRVICDIGSGNTSSDFSIYTCNVNPGTISSKTLRFRAKSNDGQTYAIFWRIGTTVFQGTVGPLYSYCDMTGITASGSTAFQIGLRRGGSPYLTSSFCDITIDPLYLQP